MQSYRMAAEGNPDLSISKIRADRDIHRYLMDEIFGRLSPEIRRFLLCTSLLPNLEVRMCDSLLGIGNSRDILEELVSRNIFTLCISGSTYRYHELLRDFLQQNDDGSGLETVRRAMAWHFDRGDYEHAADYALLADDAKFIHDCISAALGRPFAGGRYRRLKEYFDCLEAHHTELTPRVLLARGMYLSSRGNFFEADRDLSAAADQIRSEERAVYLYAMTHKARVLRNNVSFEESSRCLGILLPLLEGQPMATLYAVVIEKIYNLTLTSQLNAALELTRAMIEKCSVSAATCGLKRGLNAT
ncbi:MAG: hypothetical protein QME73_02915 [Bacillota bacterium]|nr:hypothetical protein [Bacillota bacterium]